MSKRTSNRDTEAPGGEQSNGQISYRINFFEQRDLQQLKEIFYGKGKSIRLEKGMLFALENLAYAYVEIFAPQWVNQRDRESLNSKSKKLVSALIKLAEALDEAPKNFEYVVSKHIFGEPPFPKYFGELANALNNASIEIAEKSETLAPINLRYGRQIFTAQICRELRRGREKGWLIRSGKKAKPLSEQELTSKYEYGFLARLFEILFSIIDRKLDQQIDEIEDPQAKQTLEDYKLSSATSFKRIIADALKFELTLTEI